MPANNLEFGLLDLVLVRWWHVSVLRSRSNCLSQTGVDPSLCLPMSLQQQAAGCLAMLEALRAHLAKPDALDKFSLILSPSAPFSCQSSCSLQGAAPDDHL